MGAKWSQPPLDGGGPALSASAPAQVQAAWRSWLSALATDAEAAMAAALAYESLPPEARDAWLDALAADRSSIDVPAIALYAPLLAVECDVGRCERIQNAIVTDPPGPPRPCRSPRALRGVARDGTHAWVLVTPVYLDFVQVLSCRHTTGGGFVAVRHDPLRHTGELHSVLDVDGVAVEPTPLRVVVEELALAILADKREHRETPAALASFAHLFVPDLESAQVNDRGEP